jgi:hypothetical protein
MCLAPLTSNFFPSFALPMQAVSPPPQETGVPSTVLDRPGAYTTWSVTLHTSTNFLVCAFPIFPPLVPCCLSAHFCFSAPLPPRTPFFRVSWSHIIGMGFVNRGIPEDHKVPPIISPTSFSTVPSLQNGSLPSACLLPSYFSFCLEPFFHWPLSFLRVFTHSSSCVMLV